MARTKTPSAKAKTATPPALGLGLMRTWMKIAGIQWWRGMATIETS